MRYSFFRPKRRLHSGYNKQLYCRSSSETLRREHIGSRGIPRILRTLEKIPKGRPRNWAEDGFILEATTAVDLCRNKIPELGYNPPTSALLQPAIIAEFSEKGSINGSVKVLLESSECERGCAVFAFIMMHCERVSWLTREAKYYPQTKYLCGFCCTRENSSLASMRHAEKCCSTVERNAHSTRCIDWYKLVHMEK